MLKIGTQTCELGACLLHSEETGKDGSFLSRSIFAPGIHICDLSDYFHMRAVFGKITVDATLSFRLHIHVKYTSKIESNYEKTEKLEGELGKKAYCTRQNMLIAACFAFAIHNVPLCLSMQVPVHMGSYVFFLAGLLFTLVQSISLTSWNMFGCHPSFYFADEIGGTW